MATPFNIPDDSYFQKLEEKLNRIPNWQSPSMETPEMYFPQLEERILSKTIDQPKGKVRPLWIRWASVAAAAVVMVGGYYLYPTTQDAWQGVSNEDILVYMEEHQSTALPLDEMNPSFDAQNLVPLQEMSEQDIQAYDEVYGI